MRLLVGAALDKTGFAQTLTAKPGSETHIPKLQYVQHFEPWDWVIGGGLYIDDLEAIFYHELRNAAGMIVVVTLAVGALAWAMAGSILPQIGGEPADAVKTMRGVAGGDLTVSLDRYRENSMLGKLNRLVVILRRMMSDIGRGAEQVASAARKINGTATAVAEAAAAESGATQTKAAAMEQLTVSIAHISDNAGETERFANNAADLAVRGEQSVKTTADNLSNMAETVAKAADQVRTLGANAQEVARVTAVIKDIAGQTNLLALNAATSRFRV